jgi:hypothetical protein
MLSTRTALVAAAALMLMPCARAHGQTTPPSKRVNVVVEGMTPGQVRALLGEPLRTRREGDLAYMYYPNGSGSGAGDDYVVVRDCRVVAARFEVPGRFVARRGDPDAVAPPSAECRLAASEPAPLAVTDEMRRNPPPPNDVNPAGAPPAERPAIVPVAPAPPAAADAVVGEAPAAVVAQQDPAEWRRRLTLRRPVTHLVAVPAASISSPTAFGSQFGEAFIGVAWQQRTRFTDLSDGGVVLGAGLGNRERAVGVELALTSYSTIRGDGPFETGGVSVKVHRAFGELWGAAVGYENAVSWGGSDAGHSPYAVVTRVFRFKPDATEPFSALAATLGVGAGRFRFEEDVDDERETANVFGALGLQVIEPVSITADWNGQDLFAGVSVAPVRRIPVVINAGFADLTGTAGDGARFILSAALGFRYLPPFF